MNTLEIKKVEQEIKTICNKITEENVFFLEYNDLEKLLIKYYSLDQDEICSEEFLANDTTVVYNVDGKLDKWDQKSIKQTYATKKFQLLGILVYLNDICTDGYIKAGKYIINRSW